MVSTKDILIEICLGFCYLITSALLIIFINPILIIPNFILFVILKIHLKRKKIIAPYVKDDFLKLGYEIVSERPLTFGEQKFEISLEPTIGGMPISRYNYLRRFTRIFTATNKEGKKVVLNSVITKKWNGENKIEIINKRNV